VLWCPCALCMAQSWACNEEGFSIQSSHVHPWGLVGSLDLRGVEIRYLGYPEIWGGVQILGVGSGVPNIRGRIMGSRWWLHGLVLCARACIAPAMPPVRRLTGMRLSMGMSHGSRDDENGGMESKGQIHDSRISICPKSMVSSYFGDLRSRSTQI
jgi:hypothetical protein